MSDITRPDFRAIKQAVKIDQVCARYSIPLRKVNHTSLRGACPLPTHPKAGGNSFAIDTAKNVYSCHQTTCVQARGGKKGGDLISFVAVMEQCSLGDAGKKLAEWFDVNGGSARPEPKPRAETEAEHTAEFNRPLAFQLKDVRYHEYLEKRGITEATAKEFGAGFFPGKSNWLTNHRIVIPIHNPQGELVAYAGRALEAFDPKYLFPRGFRKSLALFNLHRVKGEEVILVEGFFPVMWLHQLGYHAVGLMGSSLSDAQQKLLKRFKRVVIMLDGDEAGRAAAGTIAAKLMKTRFVRVVDLPEGIQPDALSAEELRTILL